MKCINKIYLGLMHSSTAPALLKRLFVSMDEAISQAEQRSKMLGRPVTQLYIIADAEHFEIRQFLPAVNLMGNMSKIFSDNYPEILKKSLIFNVSSPKIISMGFNLVRPFIDENTQKKIFFHGKDTWKEALFKDVDPSQVPEIWGGTFTFENADDNWWQVLSLPRSIPESCYKAPSSQIDEKGTARVTVNKRGKFCVTVDVTETGTEIRWYFTTENFDIGFGISLKAGTRREQILPITRTDSHLKPESGTLLCSQVGTYEIRFDNTYSIARSKKLLYKIDKVSPSDISHII